MTTCCAIKVIEDGGSLTELAEAVGQLMETVKEDPFAVYALIKALQHGGFIAEQATLGLYRTLEIPLPTDRDNIDKSESEWADLAARWRAKKEVDALISATPGGG